MNTRLTLLLFASLALLLGCSSKVKPAENLGPKVLGEKIVLPEGSPQMASLTVESVELCKATPYHLNGRLVWDDDVTVRVFTPFAGRVTRILAEVGKVVGQGEPLALIASPDYGQAQSDALRAASDFVLAEHNLNRASELFAHGAAPLKDLHAAEAEFARAQSEKQRTTARLALYGGNTNTIDQVYVLKSPLSGVVVEKNLNPGQEVRPDQMLANAPQFFSPLFVITDPTRLWVQLDATEQDLPNLKPGRVISVSARPYPDRVIEGKIDVVSDFLDPITKTLKVRGVVNNLQRLLKAEMYVNVDLPAERHDGIDVPANAVFLKGENRYVFLEEGLGQFVQRQIKVGSDHDGKTLVLEGLQPGQRVVTDGCLLLKQMLESAKGT